MSDIAPTPEPVPIRDAATVVVTRRIGGQPHLLMGQRGSAAVFMPDKFVFPGGAVDPTDADVPLAGTVAQICQRRLGQGAGKTLVHALQVAALRELHEETGLRLDRPGTWPQGCAPAWNTWAGADLMPDATALRFVYRAITPPQKPRRFDARFFLVDAEALSSDPDDFSQADAELSSLQWLPLEAARGLDLPFITTRVLAEIEQVLADPQASRPVPFFRTTATGRVFDEIV